MPRARHAWRSSSSVRLSRPSSRMSLSSSCARVHGAHALSKKVLLHGWKACIWYGGGRREVGLSSPSSRMSLSSSCASVQGVVHELIHGALLARMAECKAKAVQVETGQSGSPDPCADVPVVLPRQGITKHIDMSTKVSGHQLGLEQLKVAGQKSGSRRRSRSGPVSCARLFDVFFTKKAKPPGEWGSSP